MALPAAFAAMPRRNQLIILHGVPAVVAIGLAWWCWSMLGTLGKIDYEIDDSVHLPFMRDEKDSLWTQIQAKKSEIDGYQNLINQGPSIKKNLDALQLAIKNLNERLPTESEKAEMRQILEQLARDVPKDFGTVQLKRVNIIDQGAGRTAGPRTVTYQVDLVGNQDGIIKYIDSIERFQRFMMVQQITISTGGFGTDEKTKKILPQPHTVSLYIETKVNSAGAK